jgi:uncharacterized ferritin-like protein (DUF455 family)
MPDATSSDTKVVRGVTLRNDPAREPCYRVVDLHQDLRPFDGLHPEGLREMLHRSFNQEVQTIEIAAQCLVDFPSAPWELRLDLARQCWDESRHAGLYYRRLKEVGGRKGEFPIANLDWSVVSMLDSLPARLTVQQRTFEAGSLEVDANRILEFRAAGDDTTADIMEGIEADEIQHVRFANDWLKRLSASDPRTVLKVASAMAWVKGVIEATSRSSDKHAEDELPVNVEARRLAGFSNAEIEGVLTIANQAGRERGG